MLRPGWTETVVRTAVLAIATAGMASLAACGTLDARHEPALVGAASAAIQKAPTPELQSRYEQIVTRLKTGDASVVPDLEKFSADHPELAGPLLNLAMVRARAGEDTAARALFEQASTVCNRCGPVWNELGILHRQQGRFADAELAYQRAIELEPGYALPYYNLAMLYELYIPRPDLALQSYEQYLQLGGSSGEGQEVEKWVADLRRRAGATPKTARAEGAT